MSRHPAAAPDRAPTLSFWLLIAFLAILWIAGGASRADVFGQSVVRFSAWSIVIMAVLALPRVNWRAVKEPAIILGAAALLIALQLVPLPPSIWTELPGRAVFAEAAVLTGTEQPWRPLSISPNGTTNALASLIVPAVVLLLAANLTREQHWRISVFVLGMVGAGAVLGVLQFSGANFDNPLINTVPGAVAGNLSNRNHFALFLAIGCVLALTWAFRDETPPWKAAAAFGLIVIFTLTILATGSRSGVIVGMAGIVLTFLVFRRRAAQQFKAMPRKIAVPVVVAGVVGVIGAIWLSVGLDRAVSVNRATMLEGEADLRSQIWPIVLDMIQRYLPAGTGFGTFDPVFRIGEPDNLLNPQYINLAHNDWLQIVLEGGLIGLVLLAVALTWLALRSFQAWNSSRRPGGSELLAKAGSILVILVLAASVSDYPARTPLVMALLSLAAVWLARAKVNAGPGRHQLSRIA
jgi:O-antigen ligase